MAEARDFHCYSHVSDNLGSDATSIPENITLRSVDFVAVLLKRDPLCQAIPFQLPCRTAQVCKEMRALIGAEKGFIFW